MNKIFKVLLILSGLCNLAINGILLAICDGIHWMNVGVAPMLAIIILSMIDIALMITGCMLPSQN